MTKADFSALRQIPILSVCNALGIPLRKTGYDVWNVESKDDPKGFTSLTIFQKSNRWKRFSSDEGGSVLDLVIHIRSCTLGEAADFLKEHFPSIHA